MTGRVVEQTAYVPVARPEGPGSPLPILAEEDLG